MTNIFSTYRVAALMDESMFELPDEPRGTTVRGDPWLRWAKVGNYAGWYSVGERKPDFGERMSFWEAVLTLATEVGNGHLDAVHCIGPGILSVGGLGVTLSSGYAQWLLMDCLEESPSRWISMMGPALIESGCWMEQDQGIPTLRNADGPILGSKELSFTIRRGADQQKWTAAQKRRGGKWVECTSKMLRHSVMDEVQVRFCAKVAPDLLDPIHNLVGWPRAGIRDGWMYTQEQQALWCVLMVAAIEDEDQTWRLAESCVKTQPQDARGSLLSMFENVHDLADTGTFSGRVHNAIKRVQDLFRVELL